jgi:nucleotide-binding universal stress UspA family protein
VPDAQDWDRVRAGLGQGWWGAAAMFKHPWPDDNVSMDQDSFSGRSPIVVGVLPEQHIHILHTVRDLAAQMNAPLVFAYVDEASYLVEWDPSKGTHRLSLHPERGDNAIAGIRAELRDIITAYFGNQPVDWTLRILAGDPARALGRLASDVQASMIIVGTPERGLTHRISEALNGSVASWLTHHQGRPVLIVPTPKRVSHGEDALEAAVGRDAIAENTEDFNRTETTGEGTGGPAGGAAGETPAGTV